MMQGALPLARYRFLLPAEHAGDACGNAEHDHGNLNQFRGNECEHLFLGVQLCGGDAQENEVHNNLRQNGEYAPLPRTIQKQYAPRTDEHPDVVGVNQGQQENVGFAFVAGAIAAPASALVEQLLPGVHRCGFNDGVLIQVVADLGARDFHHLVDEHVVVTAA